MPVYEYSCTRCDKRFEKIAAAAESKPPCPECGCDDVQQLPSAFVSPSGSPSCGGNSGGG